jgi:membrane associated rhomboid family serine protease
VLPIGDYPNPPRAQWATRILVGLNVAIHLFVVMPLESRGLTEADVREHEATLQEMWAWQGPQVQASGYTAEQWVASLSQADLLTNRFGYRPGAPSFLALLACMFLHGGLAHLGGNMLFLWIYGDNVEYRLGPLRFVAWYLVTGMVGTLAFAFMNQGSPVPLVGASGAISGVLGFYLVWFPRNYVKVFFFFPFIGIFAIRAYWVLGMYLVIDNLMPIAANRGGSVAHGAHVGGFVAGMALAWLHNRIKGAIPAPRPERFASYRPGVGPTSVHFREARGQTFDHSGDFEAAVVAGRMQAAAHAFSGMQREGGSPPNPEAVFRLAHWLYEKSYIPDAAAVFRYYLKRYPKGEDLDRVHLGLGVLLARRLGQPEAAKEHLHQAIEITDTAAIADSARQELETL